MSTEEDSTDEVLEKKLEEARYTLDHQLQISQNNEDKAFRVLQFNLVIIGAIFTAFSIAPSIDIPIKRFINIFTVFGFSLLLFSIFTASISFLGTVRDVGISDRFLDNTSFSDINEINQSLIHSYRNWLQFNTRTVKFQSVTAIFSIIQFIDAIIFSIVGIIMIFLGIPVQSTVYYIIFVVVLLISILIGFLSYYSGRFIQMITGL